jgi:hypothetical protein
MFVPEIGDVQGVAVPRVVLRIVAGSRREPGREEVRSAVPPGEIFSGSVAAGSVAVIAED